MYISAAVGRWIDQSVSFYDEMGWVYCYTPGGITFPFFFFSFSFSSWERRITPSALSLFLSRHLSRAFLIAGFRVEGELRWSVGLVV